MLNMIPKVKFELVVDDGEVGPLVDLIRATARTGEVGDGKIFIFPVKTSSAYAPGKPVRSAVEEGGWPRPPSQCVTVSVGAALLAARRDPFTAVVFGDPA